MNLMLANISQLFVPFKGNDNCDEDRAADRDIVDGVKELGKQNCVELAAFGEWPAEDPGKTVVKDTEYQEDVIEAGKSYEEVVEGVLHVLRGQDVDRESVAEKPKDSKGDLEEIILEAVSKLRHVTRVKSLVR